MNFVARWLSRTVLVLAAISPTAFARVANPPPRTAPQPRKRPLAQRGTPNAQNAGLKTKDGKDEKAREKAREKADKEARKRAKKAKKHSK
jgi:hypothetical protein